MHNRVAQQVLERPDHFFQHAAIDLYRAAVDIEIDALVDFLRRLSRYAVQALRDAGKLHHAYAHQILLQIAGQACLCRQVRGGAIDGARQVLLHRADVIDALGHHARQLLQTREAVEF